jgi:hypothetical protein
MTDRRTKRWIYSEEVQQRMPILASTISYNTFSGYSAACILHQRMEATFVQFCGDETSVSGNCKPQRFSSNVVRTVLAICTVRQLEPLV